MRYPVVQPEIALVQTNSTNQLQVYGLDFIYWFNTQWECFSFHRTTSNQRFRSTRRALCDCQQPPWTSLHLYWHSNPQNLMDEGWAPASAKWQCSCRKRRASNNQYSGETTCFKVVSNWKLWRSIENCLLLGPTWQVLKPCIKFSSCVCSWRMCFLSLALIFYSEKVVVLWFKSDLAFLHLLSITQVHLRVLNLLYLFILLHRKLNNQG